jgi:hypothetical protein
LPDFERGHPILPPVSPIYEELDYGPRTSQSINGPTSIALGWQGNGSTIRPPLNPPLVIGIFCPLAGKFFYIDFLFYLMPCFMAVLGSKISPWFFGSGLFIFQLTTFAVWLCVSLDRLFWGPTFFMTWMLSGVL